MKGKSKVKATAKKPRAARRGPKRHTIAEGAEEELFRVPLLPALRSAGRSSEGESGEGWIEVEARSVAVFIADPLREAQSSRLYTLAAAREGKDDHLRAEIDSMLRQIEEMRAETHAHDEEIARLRDETRGMIDEMMRDLNLKAA